QFSRMILAAFVRSLFFIQIIISWWSLIDFSVMIIELWKNNLRTWGCSEPITLSRYGLLAVSTMSRSEERRVGKECKWRRGSGRVREDAKRSDVVEGYQ